MSLTFQYIMMNILSTKVSEQIFIVSSVLCSLLFYKLFACLEINEKTRIENSFLNTILQKFYKSQFENYTGETHYDFVTGYFWNLLNSVTGIFQKFYLKVYLVIFIGIILCLLYYNFLFASISVIALTLLFLYIRYKLNDIELLQRKMVSSSSDFSYLFESSIDGIFDISVFNKKDLFYDEFQKRLTNMLDVKLASAKLNDEIMTSIQVFSVLLLSSLILCSHFIYFSTSIVSYANSVLIILLVASILQPLLTTWISYKRSQYSLHFINVKNKIKNVNNKNRIEIRNDDIETIKINNLGKNFGNLIAFRDLNMKFAKGHIYILRGENGSGKSTFFKILLGLISPTFGEIEINDIKFHTLVGTDIRKYFGVYSNEFRLFADSIENNYKFSLFENPVNFSATTDNFIGLPNTYQVSSNGKNLSQGQQQKTLLKRALYDDKAVYLFDEPTSNLDTSSKEKFLDSISNLRSEGKIICIITHDSEIINIADKIFDFNH